MLLHDSAFVSTAGGKERVMKTLFYCKKCKKWQTQEICTVNNCKWCGQRLPCVWERSEQ